MSEEVKEETVEAAPAEEAKEEQQAAPEAETTPSTPAKKKKINRLTSEELDKKLADMKEKNLAGSKYYKHLQERKNELTPKA